MKNLRRQCHTVTVTLLAMLAGQSHASPDDTATQTPIKRVIVVMAENRSFDHVFGVYTPKPGQTISNLRSKRHHHAIFFSDGSGGAITPPSSVVLANPNPRPNTTNSYTADGNWSHCGDVDQPGVGPIVKYLSHSPTSSAQTAPPAIPTC